MPLAAFAPAASRPAVAAAAAAAAVAVAAAASAVAVAVPVPPAPPPARNPFFHHSYLPFRQLPGGVTRYLRLLLPRWLVLLLLDGRFTFLFFLVGRRRRRRRYRCLRLLLLLSPRLLLQYHPPLFFLPSQLASSSIFCYIGSQIACETLNSVHRITELLSRMKCGNREIFH